MRFFATTMRIPMLRFISLHYITLFAAMISCSWAIGQNYPPKMEDAETYVYKRVGDTELKAYVFAPEQEFKEARPAIVFFFGGGWRSGSPKQFEQHSRYLAARGMIAICIDYRVASRHNVKAVDCVRDAKSAIRWAREQAAELGIDPDRIVAGGGSAGGHLAACTGVIKGLDETTEDPDINSRPNAMALFNPALVLAPVDANEVKKLNLSGEVRELGEEKLRDLERRMGVPLQELSPYHQLPAQTGPCIIFHGKADTTVPYQTAELFAAASSVAGNRCELIGYEEKGHGFFNFGREKNEAFRATLSALDDFLVSLNYLPAEKT